MFSAPLPAVSDATDPIVVVVAVSARLALELAVEVASPSTTLVLVVGAADSVDVVADEAVRVTAPVAVTSAE